jgi:hypothetical protein
MNLVKRSLLVAALLTTAACSSSSVDPGVRRVRAQVRGIT